jgi:hypothetical protein
MNPSSSCMHDTMNAPVSKVFSFLCVLCMNSTQAYMGGLGFPFVCPHVLMIKYLEDFLLNTYCMNVMQLGCPVHVYLNCQQRVG